MDRARRAYPLIGAFGLALVASCTGGSATGFDVTVSSLLQGAVDHVVVRVFDAANVPVFCNAYSVDETRAPGETISLVRWSSAIALAPAEDEADRVRVVVDAYSGKGGSCDAPSTVFAKKTVIARYVPGRVLPLHLVFDLACAFVTCDEASSTCRRGTCVDAADLEASGVSDGGPCFDLRTCPNLTRGEDGPDACTFTMAADPGEGYVAVAFRFPASDSTDPEVTGAALLEPGDYEVVPGNGVKLLGRTCEFATRGDVTAVYLGYRCAKNGSNTRICAVNSPDADGPLATVATGGSSATSSPDAGTDATLDAAQAETSEASTDGAPDARSDGSTDARNETTSAGDGSPEGGADGAPGDGNADGRGDDGASGNDGATGGTSFLVCRSPAELCPTPSTICCDDPSGTGGCLAANSVCSGASFACDDWSDCANGQECCRGFDGQHVASICVAKGACDGSPELSGLCSRNDVRCRDGYVCMPAALPPPSDHRCEDVQTLNLFIDCTGLDDVRCDVNDQCCLVPSPACQPRGTPCPAALTCDDQFDCETVSGQAGVCCRGTGPSGGSVCRTESECDAVGGESMCRRFDPRCPPGKTCDFPSHGATTGRCR
ncbi:MAG: hypothetical protein U0169_17315 [Polyangiaceae bacterium]